MADNVRVCMVWKLRGSQVLVNAPRGMMGDSLPSPNLDIMNSGNYWILFIARHVSAFHIFYRCLFLQEQKDKGHYL